MGDITQTAPASTVTTLDGATLDGEYVRADPDALSILELVEIDVFRHESGHTGEASLWHFLGNIPAVGVTDDSFSIPLPSLGLLADDYCWRVRVRDIYGVWSSWYQTAASIFSLSPAAPTLSDARPPSGATPETMDGMRFSAAYSDSGDNPAVLVATDLIAQAAAEAWDDGDYALANLLWSERQPPRNTDDGRVEVRYSGRRLRLGFTYLWRMRVQNSLGAWSDYIGGDFDLDYGGSRIIGPAQITFADA